MKIIFFFVIPKIDLRTPGSSREQILSANGFSNRFWGWGGEDNEIERRIYQSGLGRIGADEHSGRYTMLKHEHAWSFDPKRKIVISTSNTGLHF